MGSNRIKVVHCVIIGCFKCHADCCCCCFFSFAQVRDKTKLNVTIAYRDCWRVASVWLLNFKSKCITLWAAQLEIMYLIAFGHVVRCLFMFVSLEYTMVFHCTFPPHHHHHRPRRPRRRSIFVRFESFFAQFFLSSAWARKFTAKTFHVARIFNKNAIKQLPEDHHAQNMWWNE